MDDLDKKVCDYDDEDEEIDADDYNSSQMHKVLISCEACCEKQQEVTFNSCEDIKDAVIHDINLKNECRFLKINVKLKKVCSGRKITVAVIVSENICGIYVLKGMKGFEFTVPGTNGRCMENVDADGFCFIFPDEDLCSTRKFKINVIAHYSSFHGFPFSPVE
jgi:hypothetical protein